MVTSLQVFQVLSLPMRNWNTPKRLAMVSMIWRFEPTYEELKPADIILFLYWYSSFEPTYEELKQNCEAVGNTTAPMFWAYLWGIETWCLYVKACTRKYVLSLPMRNWNVTSQKRGKRWVICFEPTYEELKPYNPWRNGKAGWSFEPTYEELKHH